MAQPLLDSSTLVPKSVSVRFAGRLCASDVTTEFPEFYVKEVLIADAFSGTSSTPTPTPTSTPTSTTQAGFPATQLYYDDCPALFNDNGDPTNKSTIDDLSLQIAKDFYAWQLSPFDRVYSGVVPAEPNGLIDEIIINYGIRGCSTRIKSSDYTDEPEQLCHHDPASADCGANPRAGGFLVYGPSATGTGSSSSLTAWNVLFQDGRLKQDYVETDIVPCGCQPCLLCIDAYNCNKHLVGSSAYVLTNIDSSGMVLPIIPASANNVFVASGIITASGAFCFTTEPGKYMIRVSASGYIDDEAIVKVCI